MKKLIITECEKHTCPVCLGSGLGITIIPSYIKNKQLPCVRCDGTGVIYLPVKLNPDRYSTTLLIKRKLYHAMIEEIGDSQEEIALLKERLKSVEEDRQAYIDDRNNWMPVLIKNGLI